MGSVSKRTLHWFHLKTIGVMPHESMRLSHRDWVPSANGVCVICEIAGEALDILGLDERHALRV